MREISSQDQYLLNEGSHLRLYEVLGSHVGQERGRAGVRFSTWAPNAEYVSVIGEFNGWSRGAHPLSPVGESGIWTGFIPGVGVGQAYKYFVVSRYEGYASDRADPYAVYAEQSPSTASRVWTLDYEWHDAAWLEAPARRDTLHAPMSIYEVHLGSWRRNPLEGSRSLTYRELAEELPAYVREMGFTHVEIMPVTEHPFYGSWGYQTTGFFAPTSRYGTPQDFMLLVDRLHAAGIGVILDWVPSHFPTDEFALGYFDGTHLYEHGDPRQGYHPDWGSLIFNYGRHEIRSFLLSSALYWIDKFHIDGLRVDAVASMLYLDYSRKEGEWIPNPYGGRENLEAIGFLRRFNEEVYGRFPRAFTMAEESTAWPMVSRPTSMGGLGFGLKWDMGWMHDTLKYLARDPIHRRHHHGDLTFRMIYAHNENFVLPLSHDEVVHGKGSLLNKMPGDSWQQFANLRLLYGYQFAQPGKKLLFMGGEFAQRAEWNHDASLDWHLVEADSHGGVQRLVRDLNKLHSVEPALHEQDCAQEGFEWIDGSDAARGLLVFVRWDTARKQPILVVLNFTPEVWDDCRVGSPVAGAWELALSTDDPQYWGSGVVPLTDGKTKPVPWHGRPQSITLRVPPLAAVFLRLVG